jgi:hypothetical protein
MKYMQWGCLMMRVKVDRRIRGVSRRDALSVRTNLLLQKTSET